MQGGITCIWLQVFLMPLSREPWATCGCNGGVKGMVCPGVRVLEPWAWGPAQPSCCKPVGLGARAEYPAAGAGSAPSC